MLTITLNRCDCKGGPPAGISADGQGLLPDLVMHHALFLSASCRRERGA